MGIYKAWNRKFTFAVNDFQIFDMIGKYISIDNSTNEANSVVLNNDVSRLNVAIVP